MAAGGYVLGAVSPGGRWDYKIQPGSAGDEMGNFNFGATGSFFLPGDLLARGAGAVQIIQGATTPKENPYRPEFGNPFGSLPNVGDDPRDTNDILAGAGECR